MDTLRIPQRMVPVRVLLADSQVVEGGLYVPAVGPDGRPGRLLDRLNDDAEEFMPLAGRYETLLSKSSIVHVQLASGHERVEGIEDTLAREQQVRLVLRRGSPVQGWIRYLMPEEKARLLDYLNVAPRFIPLIGTRRVTVVNRCFIVSVQELTGVSAVK